MEIKHLMKRTAIIVAAFTVLLVGAAPARAQVITPFAGLVFGGYAEQKKLTMGASVSWLGKGLVGFEFDGGYTPDFFGEQQGVAIIAKSNVTTLTGSLLFSIPPGGAKDGAVRPYISAGFGLMLTRLTASGDIANLNTNDTALTAGAGVIVKVADHLGVRFDARYFRRLQDPSDDNSLDVSIGRFQFWRATVGVVFRM